MIPGVTMAGAVTDEVGNIRKPCGTALIVPVMPDLATGTSNRLTVKSRTNPVMKGLFRFICL